MTRVAVDIGGANLKIADIGGSAYSVPFALWRDPNALAGRLTDALAQFAPLESLAVTMTAELCDCFATRADGVRHILDAVETTAGRQAIPDVRVWTTRGELVRLDVARQRPLAAAAANWLALATWAAREFHDRPGVLVDIGSTTTDVIAFSDREALPVARDDTGRLASGELLYAGVSRTPVCAIVDSLEYRSSRVAVAAELFATMDDVYLVRGDVPEQGEDRDSADGRARTREMARARISRMLCLDPPDLGEDEAWQLAEQLATAFESRVAASIERVVRSHPIERGVAVISGRGEFAAQRALERVTPRFARVESLAEKIGEPSSVAACAFALVHLATTPDG